MRKLPVQPPTFALNISSAVDRVAAPLSQLGHIRAIDAVSAMSALPPIATDLANCGERRNGAVASFRTAKDSEAQFPPGESDQKPGRWWHEEVSDLSSPLSSIAAASLYAVLYILTGAVVDSLSGPAFVYLMFIGPALVVALVDALASKLSAIHGVIAATLFAYGVSVLAVTWAGTRDVLVFGLVGAIPAAVCSWLSNLSRRM